MLWIHLKEKNLPYALHCPVCNDGFVRCQQAPEGNLTKHLDNNVKPESKKYDIFWNTKAYIFYKTMGKENNKGRC
jgi:hypothetical protein